MNGTEKWDNVAAEMWAEVDPEAIRFTTLFDEIVFIDGEITYRAHTPDHRGPLHALYVEIGRRFSDLHVVPLETSD